MDKPAIKKFAIWARNKLIADTKYRAGLVGVTETAVAEPLPQSNETVQFFDVGLPQPYRIEGEAVNQRQRFVAELNKETAKQGSYTAAYQTVVDKVAYTWFNRLIAVRYMEVNDLLPSRTRVLSSADGRAEPQIVTSPFDAVLDYTPAEQQQIVNLKNDNKLDEAFRLLFLKQCAALGDCLPRLFEQVDDYMPLLLALSFTDKDGVVCHLVNDIPESDWQDAVQIVGWLYQYYNTEPKEQVFANLKKNIKISAENIPAATQLFTPDWIVRYMVENSLGRLHVESVVSSQWSGASGQWSEENEKERIEKEKEIAEQMGWKYYLPEAEQSSVVRDQCSVISGQCSVDSDQTDHSPLSTDHYPLTTLKCIDPCMGSGHILAYLFDVLMQIYTAAGYSKRDAAASIVEHNLYGLDIDDRAAQMAYFVVMMKGCQYDSRFLRRHLDPHVYAIQESNGISIQDSRAMGDFLADNHHRDTLNYLFAAFANAKEYGSILQLEKRDYAGLLQAWQDTAAATVPNFTMAMWYSAVETLVPQLIRQAILLTQQYDVVVTNPPYMGSSGMNAKLSDYVKKYYPDTKSDMSTVCMERTINMCNEHGYMAMINIPVWMFLSSYEKLREKMLRENTIVSMVHPGRGIFGSDFGTTSFVIAKAHLQGYKGHYRRLFDKQGEVESVEQREQRFFEKRGVFYATQDNFSKIPGSPVAYWVSKQFISAFEKGTPLGDIANVPKGLSTGSVDKFMRFWYEVSHDNISFDVSNCDETLNRDEKWYPYAKGGAYRKWSGNQEYVVNWGENGWEVKHFVDDNGKQRSRPQNTSYYFHECLTYSAITSYKLSLRYLNHAIFGGGGDSIHIRDKKLFEYVFGFINSELQYRILSVISPTINFEVDHLKKLPIIIDNEKVETVNAIVERLIRCSQNDWDSFETSWDFKRHPLI